MKNPFRKEKKLQEYICICERGHTFTIREGESFWNVIAIRCSTTNPDCKTKPLCPQCFVEFINENVPELKVDKHTRKSI